MIEELDPGLRRVFAAEAPPGPDESFVQAVRAQIGRRRRLEGAAWFAGLALVAVAVSAVVFTFGPVLGAAAQQVESAASLVLRVEGGPVAALALALALGLAVQSVARALRR